MDMACQNARDADDQCGGLSTLELPVRRPHDRDRELREFGPPESGPPLDVTPLPSLPSRRELRIDVGSGRREIVNDFDFFGSRRLEDGLACEEEAQDRFSITVGDPLSAEARSRWRIAIGGGEWQTRIETTSTMTATADAFTVTNTVDAFEGDRRVFSKATSSVFPRDGV